MAIVGSKERPLVNFDTYNKSYINQVLDDLEAEAEGSSLIKNWTYPRLIGNTVATSVDQPTVAKLSPYTIAMVDTINDLRTFTFTNNGWVQVGSSFDLGFIGAPSIASLNETDIALIEFGNEILQTYRFNGSTWAAVGNGLSIAPINNPKLSELNETDVAFIDSSNQELRVYRFDGSDWSQVGSGLSLNVGVAAMCRLTDSSIAMIDSTTDTLRTFVFNGLNWVSIGAALPVPLATNLDITALNSTDVVISDAASNEIRVARFEASEWRFLIKHAEIGDSTQLAMAAVSDYEIAFVDPSIGHLGLYRFHYYTGKGPYSLRHSGFQ